MGFIIINGDKYHTTFREKFFSNAETTRHKRQPFGMAISILAVNIRVVIDKVLVAGVVRGVYIDYIDFALVGVSESGKGFEVVALDKYMVGSIGIIGDNGATIYLFQYRQLGAQTLLHLFRFVLPNKTVGLCLVEKPEQRRAFIIGQALQGLDSVNQFISVSRFHAICWFIIKRKLHRSI